VAKQKREAVSAQTAQAKASASSTNGNAASDATGEAVRASTPTVNPAEQRRLDAQRRQQLAEKTKPWKKELAALEQRMAALDTEDQALQQRLLEPLSGSEMAEIGKRLKALATEKETTEERWLEVSEAIEQIETTAA